MKNEGWSMKAGEEGVGKGGWEVKKNEGGGRKRMEGKRRRGEREWKQREEEKEKENQKTNRSINDYKLSIHVPFFRTYVGII